MTKPMSTTLMVLDAPTWTNIRGQADLTARRARATSRLQAATALCWLAPAVAGIGSAWLCWRGLSHLAAGADHFFLIGPFVISVLTLLTLAAAAFSFWAVDQLRDFLLKARDELAPINYDQAVKILDWSSKSADIDAYRLLVIADERRELCVGDFNAIALFREAEEDRQHHITREIEAERALRTLSAPTPLWAAAAAVGGQRTPAMQHLSQSIR